jgi:hypothetical protein
MKRLQKKKEEEHDIPQDGRTAENSEAGPLFATRYS